MQGSGGFVQSDQGFACVRPAHGNAAVQGVEIIGVRGLAQLEHHVVGDVNRQRDGTHAGQSQTRNHPRWSRRVHVDATNHACNKSAAADAATNGRLVVEHDGESACLTDGHERCRVGEWLPGGVRILAGDSAKGEGISAVWRHIDFNG